MSVQGGGVEVGEADRRQLKGWLHSHSTPQALATRARIVLGSAEGESIRGLAERLAVTRRTVCLWRRRYREAGLEGLRSLPRSGRPRTISAAKERAVLSATLRKPAAATHWSTRRLAKRVGLSHSGVHRIWQKYGLQPHRVETFKFSTDPDFDRKLTDVVGLYLDPPERALVLCVDERSQIQALNRTQRLLLIRPGLPARRTLDYTRHGTTSLFAALEVASGNVRARCFRRHRHVGFIAFLNSLARRYPRREIHLICDNYGTHTHPAVVRWLEAHPSIQLHFTPTRASWINLVERWFGLIREQATRRGSFDSVRRLEHAINRWLASWNDTARPFRWTKSRRQAGSISIDRQTNALSDQLLRALLTLRDRDRGRPSFVATRMRIAQRPRRRMAL